MKTFFTLFIFLLSLTTTSQTIIKSEKDIRDLISRMTIEEKIGQLALRGTSSRVKTGLTDEFKQMIRDGKAGAILNVMNREYIEQLQKIATEESKFGIPLIFGRDVIHGFKTIFPIPLGLAATWDVNIAKSTSRVAAIEASSIGIRWTFAPMLDISRDSRWGRIAESPGEDTYLASQLAKGYIEGFQNGFKDETSLLACPKHFMGYGAAEGGRDYNTVYMSDAMMRNIYLPPFKSAIEAGALSTMAAFNEYNGIPASANHYLLKEILRKELNFKGFVVSDWNSIIETIPHGYAADEKHAAQLSFDAGLNMEMTSEAYEKHLIQLIESGKISTSALDEMVYQILFTKYKMGLFNSNQLEKTSLASFYAPEHLDLAKESAIQSFVLLQNTNHILPLNPDLKIALIGPLADAPHDQLGTWTFDGEKEHTITPADYFIEKNPLTKYNPGLEYSRDKSINHFNSAIEMAKQSDIIIFIGGEESILSGEAHSRADISLPGKQEELIKLLHSTGKPVILVIMAGRPISITNIIDYTDAVLMAWHPGTMGGPAIYDVLTGKSEPGGRLPVSWPKSAGQMPLYYNHKNTGRPADSSSFVQMYDIPVGAWQSSLGNNSHYLDEGFTPHYPFGFGLTYSEFTYSNLNLSTNEITQNDSVIISTTIKNTGKRRSKEIVQLYIQDVVGSITRPVKELKGFQQLILEPGQEKKVSFIIYPHQLAFYNNDKQLLLEHGQFNVWIGSHSAKGLKGTFHLVK